MAWVSPSSLAPSSRAAGVHPRDGTCPIAASSTMLLSSRSEVVSDSDDDDDESEVSSGSEVDSGSDVASSEVGFSAETWSDSGSPRGMEPNPGGSVEKH